MRIGKLDKRIIIQVGTLAVNAVGERTQTWATAWQRSARIAPLIGREALASKQVNATVTHQITIRYTEGLTPKHRILFGTRIFDINEVRNVDEGGHQMQLMCTESV